MTYQDALSKIHSLNVFGSQPGLDRIKKFLTILGNPQDDLKFIHIAGTNGKGSTCAFISNVLTNAGYKTGLFISPYIIDFRERIQINNNLVTKELLTKMVEETFPIIEKLQKENCIITEFEYVMALSFLIYKKENCDIVVLETGLGGLLDCTNVILPPVATVITTIGLDHTDILGSTIEEIAVQKCGIIKGDSPVITSMQENSVMEIIEKTSENPVYKSCDINITDICEKITGTTFTYKDTEIYIPFIGRHQIENAKTAIATIEVLQKSFNISTENIKNGFKKAVNPARFEVLNTDPLTILDGAHNPNGINALREALETHLPNTDKVCILGMLKDKDYENSVNILKNLFSKFFTVPINNPRSLSSEQLAKVLNSEYNIATSCKDIGSAYEFALKENKPIIICGSLYLAGEIRPYILSQNKK